MLRTGERATCGCEHLEGTEGQPSEQNPKPRDVCARKQHRLTQSGIMMHTRSLEGANSTVPVPGTAFRAGRGAAIRGTCVVAVMLAL